MSGEAMRMKREIAALMRRHNLAPRPFTPLALKPPAEGEVYVEGLASPATVDRELEKFGPFCWMPIRKPIPLFFRHQQDRPVGRLIDIRPTEEGLFVRACVTDREAARCPYFSVAATVHGYSMRRVDDPKAAYALITCATLDEVSMVPDSPGNPDAIVRPALAAIVTYDLAARGIACIARKLEILKAMASRERTGMPQIRSPASAPRRLICSNPPGPAHIWGFRKPPTRSRSDFGKLVDQMEQRNSA